MNKRKRRKAKQQLNVTFHHEKDFTGLSSNKIMSPTQVPRSPWLTASCTFIRQCDTKPQGLLSDRVSSRKLAILIPLFMSSTEKKSWSDGTLQQCHLHPLVAGWTWDISCFVRCLCCAPSEPSWCLKYYPTLHPVPGSWDFCLAVICIARAWQAFLSCFHPGEAVYVVQKNLREMVGGFTD